MSHKQHFFAHRISWLAFVVLVCLAVIPREAHAAEGGTSHYIQGAYGDFLMGYIPAPGFYVRNDTVYQAGHIDGTLKGGLVYAKLNVASFLNLTKLSYMFDVPAMNGFLGVGGGIPVLLNLHVSGNASIRLPIPNPKSIGGSGNRGGLSDVFVMPVIGGWNFGECHIVVMPIVFFADRLLQFQ